MDFFDFIFNNLFFIIIVGGVIAKFLSKNKADSSEKKWKVPKPVKEIDWQEIFQQEDDPIEQNPQKTAEPFRQYEPMIENWKVPHTEQNKTVKKWQERPVKDSSVYASKNKKSYFHQLTKDEVVRGVIWSEILGPPRAKKPLEKIYRK